jgi:hypothetical protein
MVNDDMKKKALIEALRIIRSAIIEARDSDGNKQVRPNYEGAIRHCDDLLHNMEERNILFPCDPLLGNFKHYVSDSLPWTGNILAAINQEFRNLRKLGILTK